MSLWRGEEERIGTAQGAAGLEVLVYVEELVELVRLCGHNLVKRLYINNVIFLKITTLFAFIYGL